MNLEEYKKINSSPLKQVTLVLPIKENEILLGMKKRGFGKDKWNGFGGKLNPGEQLIDAMKREMREETGVEVESYEQVATLDFYDSDNPEFNQQVIVFISTRWSGEAEETEEMLPKWFKTDQIPYENMWSDDTYWLPKVLAGEKVQAEFLFGDGGKVLQYNIINI